MPNILLPIPHERQRQDADCLAACAAMVLTYLGQPIEYERLLKLLKVKPFGTPGHNLKNLATLGVQVTYRESIIIHKVKKTTLFTYLSQILELSSGQPFRVNPVRPGLQSAR